MERSLEALLSWWDVSGVDVPDIPKTTAKRARPVPKQEAARIATPKPADSPPSPEATTLVAKIETLESLQATIAGFDAGQISDHARQSVFARGNPEADIMVIGEAPGRDEDIQGKPFVGDSGQLIDKIFASIGLTEDALYMTTVVNWRPPGNRNPTAQEVTACLPFIQKHIELINPAIIVLIGGISYSALTGKSGIMKNRGQWTTISANDREIPALPIYHPSFLISQPALKKDMWQDMLSLRQKIEILSKTS